MKRITLLAAVLLPLSARPVVGATIYNTGPFSPAAGALESDFSVKATSGAVQRADDFRLSNLSQITRVNWWGLYALGNTPQGPDDFVLRIFADDGGNPSSLPFFEYLPANVGRTNTGVSSFGYDVYSYSALLPSPVTLASGTTYWLSIVNYTPTDADDSWFWSRVTSASGTARERYNDAYPWLLGSSTGVLAFNLEDTVIPEPSTCIFLAVGGALVLLTRGMKGRVVLSKGAWRLPR